MRFYEYEAKRLLAKQGITTRPHPYPLSQRARGTREAAVAARPPEGREFSA
jgi:hypothetical protein